jgi:predicted nucleic acid-binding protein
MNVVDSSGWLEYFADGPHADFFSTPIQDPTSLLVPTISEYEVFKRVLQQRGETEALRAVAFMQAGEVLDLSSSIAMHAARISLDLKIPMADSMMLASAREFGATLWTQDSDFEGLEDVAYIRAQ